MRGPVWYAKYRLPDGRQVQKKLGPAWTDRGRPANRDFTKRAAEDWLRTTLEQARRGELPGQVRTGATFADACDEFLRYVTKDRARKPSTLAGYRSIIGSMLLPAFGDEPLESITTETIEDWLARLPQSPRTKTLALVLMHGIFRRAKKVWRLPSNLAAEVEKPPIKRNGDIQVFPPRRCGRSSAPPSPSRMARLSPPRRSPACVSASYSRCAGATSTSPARPSARASYSAGALTTPKSGGPGGSRIRWACHAASC